MRSNLFRYPNLHLLGIMEAQNESKFEIYNKKAQKIIQKVEFVLSTLHTTRGVKFTIQS